MKTSKSLEKTKLSAFEVFAKEKVKESMTVISEREDGVLSNEMIEHLKDSADWKALSYNNSLNWSIELIEKYEDRWDWHGLSYFIGDKNYFQNSEFNVLLKKHKEKLDWRVICQGTNLNNNHILVYASLIDWDALSSNQRFVWNFSFLKENSDKINWKIFTECLATCETPSVEQTQFRKNVVRFCSKELDFNILSSNDNIVFTSSLINRFKDRWNWAEIINNPAIEWYESMFLKYDRYISTVPTKQIRESYMWACLVEQHAELEFLLATL